MSNKTVIDAAFNKHLKKAENALFKAGIIMSDTSKEILQTNKKYVTREVYKGIYQNLTIQPGKMILTFGNNARSKSGFPYAAAVETGRKAGKMPPVKDIRDWLIERNRTHGEILGIQKGFSNKKSAKISELKRINTIAFLIARKIGRTGTKPFPFMTPGYNAGLKKFLELINA